MRSNQRVGKLVVDLPEQLSAKLPKIVGERIKIEIPKSQNCYRKITENCRRTN
jgi:hypothetical protein